MVWFGLIWVQTLLIQTINKNTLVNKISKCNGVFFQWNCHLCVFVWPPKGWEEKKSFFHCQWRRVNILFISYWYLHYFFSGFWVLKLKNFPIQLNEWKKFLNLDLAIGYVSIFFHSFIHLRCTWWWWWKHSRIFKKKKKFTFDNFIGKKFFGKKNNIYLFAYCCCWKIQIFLVEKKISFSSFFFSSFNSILYGAHSVTTFFF